MVRLGLGLPGKGPIVQTVMRLIAEFVARFFGRKATVTAVPVKTPFLVLFDEEDEIADRFFAAGYNASYVVNDLTEDDDEA